MSLRHTHNRHTVFKVSAPRHLVHLIDDNVIEDMYIVQAQTIRGKSVVAFLRHQPGLIDRPKVRRRGLYSSVCHHFSKLSPAYQHINNTIVMINQVNLTIMMI